MAGTQVKLCRKRSPDFKLKAAKFKICELLWAIAGMAPSGTESAAGWS